MVGKVDNEVFNNTCANSIQDKNKSKIRNVTNNYLKYFVEYYVVVTLALFRF